MHTCWDPRLGLRVVVRGVGHWIGGMKNWCAADGNVTHQWKVAVGVGKFLSASLSVSDYSIILR